MGGNRGKTEQAAADRAALRLGARVRAASRRRGKYFILFVVVPLKYGNMDMSEAHTRLFSEIMEKGAGQWSVASGQWPVVSGQWSVASG